MKTPLKAAALIAAAVLALSACSSATTPEASPSATVPVLDLASVAWSTADGVPSLEFTAPAVAQTSSARLIADGSGEALAVGMVVNVSYVIYSGADATQQFSTYDENFTQPIPLDEDSVDPALLTVLLNAHVGATLIYATPDYSGTTSSALLFAMTIVSATTPLAQAQGTAVDPVPGLPGVTVDEQGKPSVDFTDAVDPGTLVTQPLIQGEGDAVELGDNVTVHYTGWVWDGAQFDSSWDRGTTATWPLVDGALIDGWVQGLQGVTVGSRVLLVIPSELGYGDGGNGTIPGGATLVFVVDVLAAS